MFIRNYTCYRCVCQAACGTAEPRQPCASSRTLCSPPFHNFRDGIQIKRHIIQDYTDFTPTTLDIPWCCGDQSSHAGMGSIVKQFLAANP